MKTNESKTPYELESLGWKITAIVPEFGNHKKGRHDFIIKHHFHFPFEGKIMMDITLKEVIEFINKFIKETTERENHLNDILDR